MYSNLVTFKDRTIDYSRPVKVFRNLNKRGVWYSIRQDNLTVAHTTSVTLENVTFVVNENTRQRILRTKQREVHAFIIGTVIKEEVLTCNVSIRYNPYKLKNFTTTSGDSLLGAKYASFNSSGVTVSEPTFS